MKIAVKINNESVIEFKHVSDNILPEGFDELWTVEEWNGYVEALNSTQNAPSPFKLTGSYESPDYIDYDIFGLHKKRTLIKGELVLVEYYREFDGTTYSDLVLKEERAYTRDSINLVQYRVQTTTWYLQDESVGEVKEMTKYYSITESVAESETRRGNLVAEAKLYALSQIGINNSWEVMTALNGEISLYIQGVTQPLKDGIANSTALYMTQEIKDTIVYILTI